MKDICEFCVGFPRKMTNYDIKQLAGKLFRITDWISRIRQVSKQMENLKKKGGK